MAALLFCSLVAIAVVVERFLFFAQQHVNSEALMAQIAARVELDDFAGAIAICDQNKGMLPKILKVGLVRGGAERADINEGMSLALRKGSRNLDRFLPIVGTIAVIAPFIGLFGTVLGIIRAFQDIALKGNSSPAVVAAGVSEALITTFAGLVVAIFAVIFFNYFKTRIKVYNQEMIVAANQLAEMLHFHNTGSPIPTELYQPSTSST